MIYGLAGQPTELFDITMQNSSGARLTAQKALLHDGLDDVELIGDVESTRLDHEHFRAGRLRLFSGPGDRLRRAVASGRR